MNCNIFYSILSIRYVLHFTTFHTSGSAKLLIIDRSIMENEPWHQNKKYSSFWYWMKFSIFAFLFNIELDYD